MLAAVLVGLGAAVAPAAPAFADIQVRQMQWHLDYLHIAEAQKISTGEKVVVAVVDTGVEAAHPDLAGQVDVGVDISGQDDGHGARRDDNGHGTAMAGLIAAIGGGPTHAYGVAPGVRILPIRITHGGGALRGDIARGIREAADRGAKVINVSFGGDREVVPQETDAVAYAVAKDAVVVAAAGNTARGDTRVVTPARIPGVIAVTGFDQSGQFWSGSVQGPEAALCAPGPGIVSTDSPTGYRIGDGTSDATAIVSAVAAMVRARYPNLDAANVINRLIRTADDAGPPGRDPQYGFGRINPLRALTEQVAPVTANPLGSPGQPSAGPTVKASSGATAGAGAAHTGGGPATPVLLGAGGLLVILVVVAFVVVARRGRRPGEGSTVGPPPNGAPLPYPPPSGTPPTGPAPPA